MSQNALLWPALFIGGISPFIGILGLLFEWYVLHRFTDWSYSRSVWAALALNTLSGLLGMFAIPAFGLLWEMVSVFYAFSKTSWIINALLAAFVVTAIELLGLRYIYKQRFPKIRWLLWYGVNLFSVAIGTWYIYNNPPTI